MDGAVMATYLTLKEGFASAQQVEVPEEFSHREIEMLWAIQRAFATSHDATGMQLVLDAIGHFWKEASKPILAMIRELCAGVTERCCEGYEEGGEIFRCAMPAEHNIVVHFGLRPGSDEWKIW
jgi:hypothetical protein